MATDERKDQPQQPAPTEQPAEIQDLAERPLAKEKEEQVKGGGDNYGWYGGDGS